MEELYVIHVEGKKGCKINVNKKKEKTIDR